jgi:ferredoxin-NADP reductase
MAAYKVMLTNRKEVAEGTMAFEFEKPVDFEFKAGQFIRLNLIDPPETDLEGNGRTFSLASAPFEERLMVATRIRDTAFKRTLNGMSLGTEVTIAGPYGSLILHSDADRPAIFLTGGIGITPFRSILLQAAHDKLRHRLLLFYSNRRPEDAAYLEQLETLEKANPNYTFIGSMTQMAKSNRPWPGDTGHINQEMLDRLIGDVKGPLYYVAGPPAMVSAIRKMLERAGVSDDEVRFEEFSGY